MSPRGTQTSCCFVWNLQRGYRGGYLQGRNREAGERTDLWAQWGKERVGWIESGADVYS